MLCEKRDSGSGRGTVGDFASGKGRSGASVCSVGQSLLCFSFALTVLPATFCWPGSPVGPVLNRLDIPLDQKPFWCAAAIFAFSGVVLLALSCLRRGEGVGDRRRHVTGRVVDVMLSNPRFGVGPSTPMRDLGLSVRLLGRGRAAECRCRSDFQPEDFRLSAVSSASAARALFGAYDYEVWEGTLYVYWDQEIAKKIREKRYRKGAGRHGRG